jgi:hypothetical protein
MDRDKATQWLQEQLQDEENAPALIDALTQAWRTIDTLQEYLLPESTVALLLARPAHERSGQTNEEPTFALQRMTLSEFFAMAAALAHYDTELRMRDRRDPRLDALERLHQRVLTVTIQPPQEAQP